MSRTVAARPLAPSKEPTMARCQLAATAYPIAPSLRFDLSPASYKVLFWLLGHQNRFKNGTVIGPSQTTIATGIKMSQATVSRAVEELTVADIVRQKDRSLWLINPDYLFGLTPDDEDPYYEGDLADVIPLRAA
ncbi:replication/maintenance protein RepL [Streptomyces erythrochromogenes]|uniref:replication/maintenance protein RepL n=1 Tax=Streptomyces erythrochromogenes TaxID=285574 RepID=UPI0037016AE1